VSLLVILIIVLCVCALVGGVGHGREGWGYYGWSPLGIVLVVILVLFLTGRLH
jgi:bacteriorhodopsin